MSAWSFRIGLFTGLLLAFAANLSAQVADINESAIRILRQAVAPQRDGSHVGLLFALRQLGDPTLKPFFHQLAQRKDPTVQVQATLALAELDAKRKVDPWLVTQLDPTAQEAVIAAGLDLELIGAEQIAELVKNQSLQPMARLLLFSEQVALAIPIEQQTLLELSKSEDLYVSGLASSLLAQLGNPRAFEEFQKRLAGVEASKSAEVVPWCVEAIRRYKLSACLPWVSSIANDAATSNDMRLRCVLTMLEIDPAIGLKSWSEALGPQPTYQQRLRCGLILLVGEKRVPVTTYDRLRGEPDEELIEAIIAMGQALSNGADPIEPLKRLIDLGHQRSTEWAMSFIKKLPPEQAERIYAFLIDRIPNPKPEQFDSTALAVQATAKLFELKPELALQRLEKATDDSEVQRAILLGLSESSSPAVGEAAAKLRRIGAGPTDSLARLLIAKHSQSLAPEDLQLLGKIAAGGGRLSQALQIQAAWLYLKHSGQTEAALAKVFAN